MVQNFLKKDDPAPTAQEGVTGDGFATNGGHFIETESMTELHTPGADEKTQDAAPRYGINLRLGASLLADYEALGNDLEQATEMAADYQRQLAGKSNELAHLAQVFERTQIHLKTLEAGIEELRTERHRLASEVVRTIALERKLVIATEDNRQLRSTLSALQRHQRATAEQQALKDQRCDERIAELSLEAQTLAKLLEAARLAAAEAKAEPNAPEPKARVAARPPAVDRDTIDINYSDLL